MLTGAALLSGCGGYCWQRCPELKEQLVRDFGVLPSAINCDSELWTRPKDCPECNAMLEKNYGVSMTTCNESPYLQPRQ